LLHHNWKFWLGLGVSAVLLLVLVYQVDLSQMRSALADANYVYLAPTVALYFVAVYFRAVRWRYLLSPLKLLSVPRLYPVVVIGYMANNLLPARLGELVRSYYLARREGINASSVLGTVAVERVYDGVTLLAWAAVGGPALWLLGEFDGASDTSRTIWIVLALSTVAIVTGALATLTCLAAVPRFMSFIDRLTGIVPVRFRPRVQELVRTFVEGLSILNSPRKHLSLFLLSLPIWAFEGAMYFLIIYSFGIDDYFGSVGVLVLVVVLLTATSNLATSIPSSIGGIGPFEVVAQQTLMVLGVGASVAGAYAAFLHLVTLWLPVNLAGLAIMWQQNLSFKGLAAAPMAGPSVHEPLGGYLVEGTRGSATTPKEGPS
jgi:uncharacterized protein (TIRG00374 family)